MFTEGCPKCGAYFEHNQNLCGGQYCNKKFDSETKRINQLMKEDAMEKEVRKKTGIFGILKSYFRSIRALHPPAWDAAKRNLSLHYHLVAYSADWQYKIVFEELHKAHKKYNQRIAAKSAAMTRKRTPGGKFS